jgi:hypothetical protein
MVSPSEPRAQDKQADTAQHKQHSKARKLPSGLPRAMEMAKGRKEDHQHAQADESECLDHLLPGVRGSPGSPKVTTAAVGLSAAIPASSQWFDLRAVCSQGQAIPRNLNQTGSPIHVELVRMGAVPQVFKCFVFGEQLLIDEKPEASAMRCRLNAHKPLASGRFDSPFDGSAHRTILLSAHRPIASPSSRGRGGHRLKRVGGCVSLV